MDLGFLINQSMLKFMGACTSGGIPHATIITRLCQVADVDWGEETLQLPMRDIESAAIQKYTIWTGGKSYTWGLGFILPEDNSDSEEEEEDHVPVPAPQPVGSPPYYYAKQEREMRHL